MKKEVLYISNMYPSIHKPYAGIFVKNHVDYIKENYSDDINLSVYAMPRSFTSKIGTILKYLKFWIGFIPYIFKRYEVIHVHYLVPNIVLASIYKFFHKSTTVVVTLHGEDITKQYPQNHGKFKFFCKSVDLFIPVGETLNDLSLKYFPDVKTLILPVGVDDRVFFKTENNEKQFDFTFVGSFILRKGLDYYTQALKEITDRKLNLLFIGSGELESSILELRQYHNVTIKKNLKQVEIANYLNLSRWIVLPSRNEGFPTVTMEGMYCGVPVLGSSISQITEQVDEGINGFIFELENVQDLKSKLLKVMSLTLEEYSLMSYNALRSWREISLSSVCEKLNNLYRSL